MYWAGGVRCRVVDGPGAPPRDQRCGADPFSAYLIIRGIKTLALRLRQQQTSAQARRIT